MNAPGRTGLDLDHPSGDALRSGPVVVARASEQGAIGVDRLQAGERDATPRGEGVSERRSRARDHSVHDQHGRIQVSARCVVVPEVHEERPPAVPSAVERSVPGYELRSVIGIGQLGEVHRAYQPTVGREVALRIFGPGIVGHPQFVRRFETASQRVTRVEHPHVVPLVDYWREPNRAVMVSRLITGGHLGERIPSSGFDTAAALAIFETVASGVASAHRHGVAHGRIRPENVLFDAEDNAFVADLGVDEICTGIISFATDAYDAPERLGGAFATPATDMYSRHPPPPSSGRLTASAGRRLVPRRRRSRLRRGKGDRL